MNPQPQMPTGEETPNIEKLNSEYQKLLTKLIETSPESAEKLLRQNISQIKKILDVVEEKEGRDTQALEIDNILKENNISLTLRNSVYELRGILEMLPLDASMASRVMNVLIKYNKNIHNIRDVVIAVNNPDFFKMSPAIRKILISILKSLGLYTDNITELPEVDPFELTLTLPVDVLLDDSTELFHIHPDNRKDIRVLYPTIGHAVSKFDYFMDYISGERYIHMPKEYIEAWLVRAGLMKLREGSDPNYLDRFENQRINNLLSELAKEMGISGMSTNNFIAALNRNFNIYQVKHLVEFYPEYLRNKRHLQNFWNKDSAALFEYAFEFITKKIGES